MIELKTPAEIHAMRRAGELSAYVLRCVGAAVKPGISTLELDQLAEKIIREEGGIPAFKGYGGYPASICASINNQVVHGIPSADTILQSGDIISIDTGAIVDGWVGDNAWTYPVGRISEAARHLLKTTESCLWEAIGAARVGNHIGDIGHACQSVAQRAGCSVVRGYVGHGIGRSMHEEPDVPNVGHRRRGVKLKAGMVLAIEPIINAGGHRVREGRDGWLVLTQDGSLSAHFEKTVAITEEGPELITVEPDHKRPV